MARNPLWIANLPDDTQAQWIGTNSTAGLSQGNTALYAVTFQINTTPQTADLHLFYAEDDAIGDSLNSGVYLNGSPVCGTAWTSFNVGFSQEHSIDCGAVTALLRLGTNWLYIDDANVGGSAGLLFSATITTTAISVPSINAGGIVNNAGSTSPVAPGSLASVYGAFPVSSSSQATAVPLPTTLSGLSMQFSGISVPLLYASPLLANVQVPWELAGQTQALATATVSNQTSVPQTVNLAPVAPGIFTPILDASYRLVDSSNPATPGTTYIQIYCTGLGPVTNQPATGAAAPTSPLAQTTTTPIVTIGGVRAQVQYSGLTPTTVGLYQVNVLVPAGAPSGNSVPVVISIGGATTLNTATIAVQSAAPSNPAPTITSLSPSSALSGSGPLTLTITGTGFIASSSVTFCTVPHAVTFVDGSHLRITLSASDLAGTGACAVVVSNPAPGGGVSGGVSFPIPLPSNPAPTITSLSPSSALSGSGPLTLTINGSGFIASSSVTFNGNSHTVSFQNSSKLSIALTASDLANAGTFAVVVSNPPPGGGNSQPATFTVTAPVPISFTGNWTGAWGSIPSGAFGSLSATLTEDASAPAAYIQGLPAYNVTGTITLNSSLCFGVVPVSGLIAGNTFAFIPTFAVGPQVTFDGMLNASGTAVSSGAYVVKSGACIGDFGIFTATKN